MIKIDKENKTEEGRRKRLGLFERIAGGCLGFVCKCCGVNTQGVCVIVTRKKLGRNEDTGDDGCHRNNIGKDLKALIT